MLTDLPAGGLDTIVKRVIGGPTRSKTSTRRMTVPMAVRVPRTGRDEHGASARLSLHGTPVWGRRNCDVAFKPNEVPHLFTRTRPSPTPPTGSGISARARNGCSIPVPSRLRHWQALLRKEGQGRTFPFPGGTFPTGSVTGMPSAV